MAFRKDSYSILDRFEFEVPPVGVKHRTEQPKGVARLEEKLALCEMLKKAQQGDAFYSDSQSHACEAGAYVLGQQDVRAPYYNGEFGAGLKIYDSPGSAARLYHYIPTRVKGMVRYTVFAPLNHLDFDPDVLLCLCETDQTEILLRASSYRTGDMWLSRYSSAIGCAWLLVYPYLSGEINYSIAGLGHGMKRRHLFTPGKQFVAIPIDRLPDMLDTLKEMPWDLPGYQPDGMEYIKRLSERLGL
ncbi:MAG: DUF169 domain-containing protein [Acidobacteria bacterium]|nr:DUF169 domain-containing protein [Acidobacteriota bacterium]